MHVEDRSWHASRLFDNGRELDRMPAVRRRGLFESADRASDTREPPADHLTAALCISIFLIGVDFGSLMAAEKLLPKRERNITDAEGRSAETRMDIGSPTRARTWDLRINSPSGHRPESRARQRS